MNALPRGWWQTPCWYVGAVLNVYGYRTGHVHLGIAIMWTVTAFIWALALLVNALERR